MIHSPKTRDDRTGLKYYKYIRLWWVKEMKEISTQEKKLKKEKKKEPNKTYRNENIMKLKTQWMC